jgi:hypothetical protein
MSKIHVMLSGSTEKAKAHTYDGDYEVAVTQAESIIVTEMVPNVSGVGEPTLPRVRSIYNSKGWVQVAVEG